MIEEKWIIPSDKLLEVDKRKFLKKIHSKPYFLRQLISLEKKLLMAQKMLLARHDIKKYYFEINKALMVENVVIEP